MLRSEYLIHAFTYEKKMYCFVYFSLSLIFVSLIIFFLLHLLLFCKQSIHVTSQALIPPSSLTMPPKRKKTPSFPAAPAQAPKKPRLDTHLPSPTPTPTDEDAAIPERVDSRHLFGGPGSRARLARDLPPMHSLDDIYASMTSHAMANGLGGFLGHMDRPLRVATVCSGTESPLLALEMVQRCMFPLSLSLSFLFLVGCLCVCVLMLDRPARSIQPALRLRASLQRRNRPLQTGVY